jgi:hypothetical protein
MLDLSGKAVSLLISNIQLISLLPLPTNCRPETSNANQDDPSYWSKVHSLGISDLATY